MKNRLLDNIIVWGVLLPLLGLWIWATILAFQGMFWLSKKLPELKQTYFTPLVPELAVIACALLCLGCLVAFIYLSIKGRPEHPGVASIFTFGSMMTVVGCWTIYATSSQHIDLSLVIRSLIWLFALGIIASRFGEDCKISYVLFWPIFFLVLNEHFGTFPSLSMTGIQPAEKDFLEHHFGLTQLIMTSHTALVLAKPSSFKWFWFEAEKAKAEEIKRIFSAFDNHETPDLTNAPKAEGNMPSNQKPHSNL
jgi:hypothetical protein